MAGDWIKMRTNLQRHPKVVRIASALNADRLRVVGGLHAVWCLFDEHSDDGCLCGYTPGAVDELVGWPGFAGAMLGVGWLQSDGNDTLALPEFDVHNGASAKRRAQENDRKKAERAAAKEHPEPVRNPSASHADTNVTREEKRREDKEEGESRKRASSPTRPEGVAEQTWTDWLQLRKSKKAPVTATVLAGAQREAEKAGLSLEAFLQVWCTRGSQGLQADWLKPEERGRAATAGPRIHDDAEATARMLAEKDRGTGAPPAHIRAQIADALKGKVLQ
jgi:hypothetical protein